LYKPIFGAHELATPLPQSAGISLKVRRTLGKRDFFLEIALALSRHIAVGAGRRKKIAGPTYFHQMTFDI
jgi:hypothetical protein